MFLHHMLVSSQMCTLYIFYVMLLVKSSKFNKIYGQYNCKLWTFSHLNDICHITNAYLTYLWNISK